MKKLNNKGLSIIELLVCFVIVAVISVTLLNTVMEYKSLEQTENIKNNVISYKNVVTRVLQNDISNNKLSYFSISNNLTANDNIWTVDLFFLEPFGNSSSNIYTKTMEIHVNKTNNYIIYPDVVETNSGVVVQNVKYALEETSKVRDYDGKKDDTYSDIRFLPLDNKNLVPNEEVFSLDIPIYHSELGSNYHIKIVAPLIRE